MTDRERLDALEAAFSEALERAMADLRADNARLRERVDGLEQRIARVENHVRAGNLRSAAKVRE